jgi:menaquinone-dependent protoporphyrinogen oxidase
MRSSLAVYVLVAYASKRGSTKEIAEAVAKALRGAGLEADCLSTDEVESLEPYNAVVLGSAVYMKRWRGDARHFLRTYGWRLEHLPFWVFSSGPVGEPEKDDPSWIEPSKVVKRIEQLGTRGHVVFGGRVPTEPHGPMEKAMVDNTPPEYRDRRDWGEIHAWAIGIASELKPPLSSAA